MKTPSMLKTILLVTTFVFAVLATSTVKADPPTSPAQQAQIEQLKKTYSLTTCPVSGDKLDGGMGKPIDYLYTQKNADGTETTRLVRFCCHDCVSKFNRDPQKYLKLIDDAASAQKTTSSSDQKAACHVSTPGAGSCCK